MSTVKITPLAGTSDLTLGGIGANIPGTVPRTPYSTSTNAGAALAVPQGGRLPTGRITFSVDGTVLSGGNVTEAPLRGVVAEQTISVLDAQDAKPVEVVEWWTPCPIYTYLAGAAGSGKTYLTRQQQEREQGLLLCATTGIAAINLGGVTINSTLGFFDTKSLQEAFVSGRLSARMGRLWRAGVRRLIVDEVSMLDADQLTYMVRAVNETNGRGYVLGAKTEDDEIVGPPLLGLTLVGDFAQLAPVKAAYAFESPEWRANSVDSDGLPRFAEATKTLTEIRRQADPDFIHALRRARVGDGRAVADYFSAQGILQERTDDLFDGPTLFAKNETVDRYNQLRLDKLPGKPVVFTCPPRDDSHAGIGRWGKQRSEWGDPSKPPVSWGIPQRLPLKIGAVVMLLANVRDMDGHTLYVNGDLGELVDADEEHGIATVKLVRGDRIVPVHYIRREVLKPADATRRKELRAEHNDHLIAETGRFEIEGWISYMPMRVAYASTVHKSQGLSLDRVQVNVKDAFFKSPGMMYVALSRARSAGGLRIVGDAKTVIDRCAANPALREWL